MKQLGLIGRRLGHSLSKKYFSDKFLRESIEGYSYELYELDDISLLPQLLRDNGEIVGLNVTIPYKQSVMQYLDFISPEAAAVGAVNCIRKSSDGSLCGYNTDVAGIDATLSPLLGRDLADGALVLGTGGAAKAVAYYLAGCGVDYRFVSRGRSSVENGRYLTYDELDEATVSRNQLIINATPVGMYPDVDAKPNIPYSSIGAGHILFDLVYNPEVTRFLAEGQVRGAVCIGGVRMLEAQAEAAWRIFSSDEQSTTGLIPHRA